MVKFIEKCIKSTWIGYEEEFNKNMEGHNLEKIENKKVRAEDLPCEDVGTSSTKNKVDNILVRS